MDNKCKACGRMYEIQEKPVAWIRPSSYLCPYCRDKGGKIGTALGLALLTLFEINTFNKKK